MKWYELRKENSYRYGRDGEVVGLITEDVLKELPNRGTKRIKGFIQEPITESASTGNTNRYYGRESETCTVYRLREAILLVDCKVTPIVLSETPEGYGKTDRELKRMAKVGALKGAIASLVDSVRECERGLAKNMKVLARRQRELERLE